MYLSCPNLIQKQVFKNTLLFAVVTMFFIVNVSDFTRILLVKVKKFESSYLHKKLSSANFFLIIKITCFKTLYKIIKYEEILSTFFFFSFF
jgi:hypothetical protein